MYQVEDFSSLEPITRSDADGEFAFDVDRDKYPDVPADHWSWSQIVAIADGYGADGSVSMAFETTGAFAERMKDVAPRQKRVLAENRTLKLVSDDVSVMGRIVDLEGQPVAGASIKLLQLRAALGDDMQQFVKALESAREARDVEYQWLPKSFLMA